MNLNDSKYKFYEQIKFLKSMNSNAYKNVIFKENYKLVCPRKKTV